MRELTSLERSVLAHIVVDADAWWAHANDENNRVDPETAIASKVERHKQAYLEAVEAGNYLNRAEREAQERA